MVIDRCVCGDVSFAELLDVVQRTGARTIAALQRHASVGKGCGLCLPYVRRMLQTGQVVFTELISEDDSLE